HELLSAAQAAIAEVLTPHQRRVLVALALNGVPIDVLAERLGTTRGALYKTLHDARRKLRDHLSDAGYELAGGQEAGWLDDRRAHWIGCSALGSPRSAATSASPSSTATWSSSSRVATPTPRSLASESTSRAARPAARSTRACAHSFSPSGLRSGAGAT